MISNKIYLENIKNEKGERSHDSDAKFKTLSCCFFTLEKILLFLMLTKNKINSFFQFYFFLFV